MMLRLGFDAKRFFQNYTGLGNYSRATIGNLMAFYPEHQYFLFAPKVRQSFLEALAKPPQEVVTPTHGLKSYWRTFELMPAAEARQLDVFHGLSNEIPLRRRGQRTKVVVTVHDLIFKHYPKHYAAFDRWMYEQKSRYACQHADLVVAASEHTKQDIMAFYGTPAERVAVVYQPCRAAFYHRADVATKQAVAAKYGLTDSSRFLLSVGSIIERKNILLAVQALEQLPKDLKLVVVGSGKGAYRKRVGDYIGAKGLAERVLFLENVSGDDLPVIYELAQALVYPSVYEGFGIPILEGLASGVPVITTRASCLPEVGGKLAHYVAPDAPDELAAVVDQLLIAPPRAADFADHFRQFSAEATAARLMEAYQQILG